LTLTGVVMLVYFGFISLIAWNKPLLGLELRPGLTLGVLLGALVIVTCWTLTWIYVRWANKKYDPELERIRRSLGKPGNDMPGGGASA
jgi:uncharacterized membrane protein (DUF485 family)